MKKALVLLVVLPAALGASPPQDKPLALKQGDKVVFLGNAFFERDLRHGYLETLLTRRFKDATLHFRNLGWSGDTVFGHGRASFGTPEDGYRRLVRDIGQLKPAVIFLAYGMNESFSGKTGLIRFQDGLNRLLETLAGTGARLILLTPIRHEALGPPLPDPKAHNDALATYIDVMKKAAESRSLQLIDLFSLSGDGAPLTENGIHLTAHGYRRSATAIESSLGFAPTPWRVEISVDGEIGAEGTRVTGFEASPESLKFTATDDLLPWGARTLVVTGLKPGQYTLLGRATATAAEWAKGVTIARGPEYDQFEALRAAILEKNRIHFDEWRPHNTTYIFGFRKREQGHLQPEFPLFPPIVAKKEARIAELRAPKPRPYVLERSR